jgi:hypothetical protein
VKGGGGVRIFNPAKRGPATTEACGAEYAPDFVRGEVRRRSSSWKKRREKASAKAEEGSVEREGQGGAAVGLSRAKKPRRLNAAVMCG